MPRIKSLVTRFEVDVAQRAHDCQGNGRHRIKCGDTRLKVRNGRGWDHYCIECAKLIIHGDIARLEALSREINPTM